MVKLLDGFFALGDKVTKGDPFRKAQYDYYLLWIMFIAFFSIGVGNFTNFLNSYQIHYLGWVFVMIAVLWFQYGGLKQARSSLQIFSDLKKSKEGKSFQLQKSLNKIDSREEMLRGFDYGAA